MQKLTGNGGDKKGLFAAIAVFTAQMPYTSVEFLLHIAVLYCNEQLELQDYIFAKQIVCMTKIWS